MQKKNNLGIEKYKEKLIDEAPTEKGLKWMGSDDKKTLLIKFNNACYLAKNERPFNDFPNLMELQEKNKVRDIGKVYLTDKKCSEFTQHIANVI